MKSPYRDLPSESFWRSGVASAHWSELFNLYRRKFEIKPKAKIATAGSCFAQHIATYMRENGYRVLDYERAPHGLSGEAARQFGYGLYSARYGNIYVVRHLRQLLREAWGKDTGDDRVWERDGKYFDAMRPLVEPNGFDTPEEVLAHRSFHLKRVKKLVREMDVFIYTFGLTEAWIHRASGKVYPTCPGTVAGTFDPSIYEFKNFTYNEILRDFLACRQMIKRSNESARFLLTVSPVPLTATASGAHVLTANTYSKSVLRAVAGHLATTFEDIDYFPSYEIIASPWTNGYFYERNLREVNRQGVETVMRMFFQAHGVHAKAEEAPKRKKKEDIVCDDILIEAFRQ